MSFISMMYACLAVLHNYCLSMLGGGLMRIECRMLGVEGRTMCTASR